METTGLLDPFPLWSILPLTIVIGLASFEFGYRVAHYRQQQHQEEKETPVGGMVAGTLGLLAFMLAFTFGLAGARFEDRRQVVLDEANAVGTTYLRAEMLPEPMRTEVKKLLREYVDLRVEAVQQQPEKLNEAVSKSEALQERLWAQAVAVTEKDRSPIAALFVDSLNSVIDLHATRVMAGLRSRVPAVIWIVLYVLAILAMEMIGYHAGLANSRRSIAAVALIIAFSLVLFLIADLDRPGQGMLRVSQQSMIDLRKSMK
jgi:hypothetical protein